MRVVVVLSRAQLYHRGVGCAALSMILVSLACSPPASQRKNLDESEQLQVPSPRAVERESSGPVSPPNPASEESSALVMQLDKVRIEADPDYALAAQQSLLRASYEASPARDTPEAQELVALARHWGYGIEVVPHLYSAVWDYHYFLQTEPNDVPGKTFRSRWESLMEFEYGITPEMMAVAYRIVPTVHWGAIDHRVPGSRPTP